jgi:hypothetical protein
MNTRINFSAASKAWMSNKIRKGERTVYRCQAIKTNGEPCEKAATPKVASAKLFCGLHAHQAKSAGSKTTQSGKSDSNKDSA